jgi:hypothetical protein
MKGLSRLAAEMVAGLSGFCDEVEAMGDHAGGMGGPTWLHRRDLPWERVRSLDSAEAALVRAHPDEWEPDRRNLGSRTLWPGGRRLVFERCRPRFEYLTIQDVCRVLLARDGTPVAALRLRHAPGRLPGEVMRIREVAILVPPAETNPEPRG